VHGHEELVAQEDVHFVRRERVLRRLEVDAVEDQIEVTVVGLDLRRLDLVDRVLDGELVEREGIAEEVRLLVGRVGEVHPDVEAAARHEPRRLDRRGVPRLASVGDEDRDHQA
jgi:hypothetical protein